MRIRFTWELWIFFIHLSIQIAFQIVNCSNGTLVMANNSKILNQLCYSLHVILSGKKAMAGSKIKKEKKIWKYQLSEAVEAEVFETIMYNHKPIWSQWWHVEIKFLECSSSGFLGWTAFHIKKCFREWKEQQNLQTNSLQVYSLIVIISFSVTSFPIF